MVDVEVQPDVQVQREQRDRPWKPYLEAALGFRNHWYPAFFGVELPEGEPDGGEGTTAVRSEQLLGERILFRRLGGRVYAVQDRCLHRGVPFSARPECYTKNTLTCWYHGFTYDVRDGSLVAIITDPQSPLVGKMRLRTYPVEERQGVVFVFIGDMDPPPPLAEDVQPGFLDAVLKVFPRGWSTTVKCNWRLAAENGFDASHIYIHRNAPLVLSAGRPMALSAVPLSREGMVVVDDGGPKGVVKGSGRRKTIFEAEIEGVKVASRFSPQDTGVRAGGVDTSMWMPCGLKVDPFPAPGITHFEWYVPIDEHSHKYMMTWGKRTESPDEAERFYAEVEHRWRSAVPGGFNNQDTFAREAMHRFYAEEGGWENERLYGPDVIITEWRKLASRYNRGIQRRPAPPTVVPDHQSPPLAVGDTG